MTALLFRRRRGVDVRHLLIRNPRSPSTARMLLRLLAWLGLTVSVAVAAVWIAAKVLLAPQPGEWAMTLRVGPLQVQAGVPSLLRLATASWLGPWLDGRRMATRWGPVQAAWQAPSRTLQLQCAPCRLAIPALGMEPLQVASLRLSVRRDFNAVSGTLAATGSQANGAGVQASFTGKLEQAGLTLHITAPPSAIADWYAVLAPRLPELQQAHIAGSLSWQSTLQLPSGHIKVQPVVSGLEVHGLGTETLAHAGSTCGKPSRLRTGDWLTRAVIAAEDQRFFEHPGYDLQELTAALAANQQVAGIARGGSTLTQQLAKRLVTGDARHAERKLRELLYAVEMERTLGKARILTLYLDNAPWGPGLCGAEAAARHYFGTSARKLEPAQAVWLAAMLHNPEAEAREWASQGRIDLVRAQWVARGVRGIPGFGPREREELLQTLEGWTR